MLKKRETLIANAFATAVYCASQPHHHEHIAKQISFTVAELKKLNPNLDVKEFRERCVSPF